MDKLIEWFFEKNLNPISRAAAEALHLIGEAKLIDGVLEVGCSLGLTGLVLKRAIGRNFIHHIMDSTKERLDNVASVFNKAHHQNFAALGVATADKVPELTANYDLVVFNWPKPEELEKVYDLVIRQRKTIMDAFLVFLETEELPESIRHAGKSQRYFPAFKFWVVKF